MNADELTSFSFAQKQLAAMYQALIVFTKGPRNVEDLCVTFSEPISLIRSAKTWKGDILQNRLTCLNNDADFFLSALKEDTVRFTKSWLCWACYISKSQPR